jgi:hypothetical protein
MDLRGVRPSPEELDAVEADPERLPALLEGFLHDPRFPGRVRELWSEVYRTRADSFLLDSTALGLPDEATWVRDAGEEPLRVLGELAATDRPWTDLVTAQGTLVSPTLTSVYPVTPGEPAVTGDGWRHATWTDGRPAAGVLAGNGLWLRYTSTPSNAQRGRANALARIFLCEDFLAHPIGFSPAQDLREEGKLREALSADPACAACHRSLDPLASFLFGFTAYDPYDPDEALRYHPERERLWRTTTGIAPGWFGEGAEGRLEELGQRVASDPRFARCAAQQAWTLIARRSPGPAEEDALVRVREAFIAGGATPRALARAVITHPRYADGPPALVTPAQLASEIEALTGFRWTRDGVDLLAIDAVGVIEKQEGVDVARTGYRTLAGGMDGDQVTAPAPLPPVGLLLAHARLAEAAADWAVTQDPARLLPGIDFSETPATMRERMAEAVVHVHRVLYGARVEAAGEEVIAALALWEQAHAIRGDARLAWRTLLTALLRDPRLLAYG